MTFGSVIVLVTPEEDDPFLGVFFWRINWEYPGERNMIDCYELGSSLAFESEYYVFRGAMPITLCYCNREDSLTLLKYILLFASVAAAAIASA